MDDVPEGPRVRAAPGRAGGTLLGNCPFHRLARRHTDTVCHLNLELLRGAADAVNDQHTVVLDPGPGRCCVHIQADR